MRAARVWTAYAVLPNLVFAGLAHALYLMRPAFNLDYLLVGALPARVGRRARIALFGVVFGNDVVINAAPAFHFSRPDLLRALRHIDALEPRALATGGLGLLAVSGLVAVAAGALAGGAVGPRLALGTAVVLGLADVANGTSFVALPGARSMVEMNIANSGLRKTALALVALTRTAPRPSPLLPTDSAAGPLLERARRAGQALPSHNQALVVVESLGQLRDEEAAALLVQPLTRLSDRYAVTTGDIPFQGADAERRATRALRSASRARSRPA